MASTEIELEQQLKEAGNVLAKHSLTDDELLPLLDQVENFLARVEQSPNTSMLDALRPSRDALVEDGLLRHSNVDVKVAVASCISEITRITAPDAPYEDEKMKDVFQLIVSSFENLSDKSSRSYNKRASILETVAKVRSCVVMLDLECDRLIVEMFQHFLKAIRDYHPDNVFSSMEIIMHLVLEESEDISLEMLTPILASVKKDNEEVLPVARKLGERVLEKSAEKLKPYLTQIVKSLGVSLDDYSQVVASICEETSIAVEHNDENASVPQLADESKLAKTSSDEAAKDEKSKLAKVSSDEAAKADDGKQTSVLSEETSEVAKDSVTEGHCPEEVDPAVDRSPKSVMSNGIMGTGNEEASVDQELSKKLVLDQLANQTDHNLTSKVDTEDSDAGKAVKLESKPEQTARKRGRKSNTPLINSKEPSDSSRVDNEQEAEKLPDRRKGRSKDASTSPGKDPTIEIATPSENEKDSGVPLSSPNARESEAANAPSPCPSGGLPDEARLKKSGRQKKKQSTIQDDVPPIDGVLAKGPEGTSDSEVKPQRRSGKKAPVGHPKEDKIPAGTSKKGGTASDSEAKQMKQSGKKVDAGDAEAKQMKQSGNKVDAGDSEAKPSKHLVKKGDASDSEGKPLRQSGKKGDTSQLEKKLFKTDKKEDGSDYLTKPLEQLGKRGKASSTVVTEPLSQKKEDRKRRGRAKNTTEKDVAKAEDDEMGSSPKSAKSAKDGLLEVTPRTNSKRKRTAGKEKASETKDYDDNLIGSKVKVWWPDDSEFYEGVVENYDPKKMTHKVVYIDGDEEILNLKNEIWEFVKDEAARDGEQTTDNQPEASERHKKKKAKTNSGPSNTQEKMEISPRRNLKSMASKSGRKSKDDEKADNKSKIDTSKSSGKSVSKDKAQKSSGKPVNKAAGQSKDVEGDDDAPKITTNSKQGNSAKTVNNSKGRTPPSGNKANANGSGKMKSSSSKAKEPEDGNGKSPDSGKTPEVVKGKSSDTTTTKARVAGSKSGQKRKKRS